MSEKKAYIYLKQLAKNKRITAQEYKTYKGQVRSGNLDGCLLGLKRKGLL